MCNIALILFLKCDVTQFRIPRPPCHTMSHFVDPLRLLNMWRNLWMPPYLQIQRSWTDKNLNSLTCSTIHLPCSTNFLLYKASEIKTVRSVIWNSDKVAFCYINSSISIWVSIPALSFSGPIKFPGGLLHLIGTAMEYWRAVFNFYWKHPGNAVR